MMAMQAPVGDRDATQLMSSIDAVLATAAWAVVRAREAAHPKRHPRTRSALLTSVPETARLDPQAGGNWPNSKSARPDESPPGLQPPRSAAAVPPSGGTESVGRAVSPVPSGV